MTPTATASQALRALVAVICISSAATAGMQDKVAGEPDGKELYKKYCAVCHGDNGWADGPAAKLLFPKPRDLSYYHFRLVSTDNGVPTEDDLFKVITTGMVGSSMPPHGELSEKERWALVKETRRIMKEEGAKRLLYLAEKEGFELDEETAREIANKKPGKVMMPLRPRIKPTMELLMEGRVLYVKTCAPCHGTDGRGGLMEKPDSLGEPIYARDFTAGIMKGGVREEDMFQRLHVGMPGTPHPMTILEPRPMWAMTHYAMSMLRPGAQERANLVPLKLKARRVRELPLDKPENEMWSRFLHKWVSMTQLMWKDLRIEGVLFKAVHDGKRLALHLAWEDLTNNDLLKEGDKVTDAFAIEFSTEKIPPFLVMDEKGSPNDVLYWSAGTPLPPKEKEKDAKRAHDVSKIKRTGEGGVLKSVVRWDRGFWELVVLCDLNGEHAPQGLAAGSEISIRFSAWDGSLGERDADKNVSIWHRLKLSK
jgi:DMSO reductase family type II enzyme heme b subunit